MCAERPSTERLPHLSFYPSWTWMTSSCPVVAGHCQWMVMYGIFNTVRHFPEPGSTKFTPNSHSKLSIQKVTPLHIMTPLHILVYAYVMAFICPSGHQSVRPCSVLMRVALVLYVMGWQNLVFVHLVNTVSHISKVGQSILYLTFLPTLRKPSACKSPVLIGLTSSNFI